MPLVAPIPDLVLEALRRDPPHLEDVLEGMRMTLMDEGHITEAWALKDLGDPDTTALTDKIETLEDKVEALEEVNDDLRDKVAKFTRERDEARAALEVQVKAVKDLEYTCTMQASEIEAAK